MNKPAATTRVEDLPDDLPIFPLGGVLLLPQGRLPLNVFEPRYLAMVEDAMAGRRLIGMIQPHNDTSGIFKTGCAGKITEFSETDDGRFLITLTGICRFDVEDELPQTKGYRRVKPGWAKFEKDLEEPGCPGLNKARLKELLKKYFNQQDMTCDWDAVEGTPDGKLITCLAMICPFEPSEKQALLEAQCCRTRAEMFMTMLEMAVCSTGCNKQH